MKRVSLAMMFAALASCGDPMLPADFSGPPAAAVKGNVVPNSTAREAARPRMSMQWLDDLNVTLVGQSLNYQRSEKLQTDWDIGLALPQETAKIDRRIGARSVRIAVGKIVYFDDRDGDDKLDWSCVGASCDRVMSISSQFVLYVERPPYCQAFEGSPPKARLAAGYHYYSLEGGNYLKLPATEPMSFTIIDRAPADTDPTGDLQGFALYLLGLWQRSPTGGC
jgi:hypothetical protein